METLEGEDSNISNEDKLSTSKEDSDTNSAIVTISELIDTAFGDTEYNRVHFMHIQAILYILARQLRILQRRVEVQLSPYQVEVQKSSSSLSVTEVKLHATTEKKRDSKTTIGSKRGQSTKTHPDQPKGKGEKTDAGTASYETSKVDKSRTTGKSLTPGKSTPTGEAASGGAVSASKYAGKSTSADTKQAAGKTTKDTSTADTISSTDKTSSAEKKTLGKKSTAGDAISPGEKIDADQTSAADDASTSTTKKTGRSGEKTPGGTKSSAATTAADGQIGSSGSQGYHRLLDEVEQSRERELRIISQRADSRDQREQSPTPIASMDSYEETYEKLLVVERVPAEEAAARAALERSTTRKSQVAPRLSVVTQEQFDELASTVRRIQQTLAPIGSADFPDNAELMKQLRKGASLTDAMAALQLSARFEATEKTLGNLLSIVTDLASQTPGVDLSGGATDDIEVLFGASGQRGQKRATTGPGAGKKSVVSAKSAIQQSEMIMAPTASAAVLMPSQTASQFDVDDAEPGAKRTRDFITYDELDNLLQSIYENIMKQVTDKTTQYASTAQSALKLVNSLEKKLDNSLNLGKRMDKLELLVANYSTQINVLDTGLSSQLTNYQEELTQMQHDLETGLETMAEVLANTGGDATAVAELNAHFNDLQAEIDDAVQMQKDLKKIQMRFSTDLNGLREEIEKLRDTKSDRDEVADALRDKAGIKDLNGLISLQQFDAIRGDLEKRIASAYDKFNNQETIWQRAIDDLIRELNEKADLIQVESLRENIHFYLETLRQKMKFIGDIVGEPVASALTRKLRRGGACLSCSAPALMESEELIMPTLPAMRPKTIGAEASKPKEDGDHGECYQGYPIKHQIDPRAHLCNRWCGGSHTLLNAPPSRSPPGVTITPFKRKVEQSRGADGKIYAVAVDVPKEPCSQCFIPEPPPAPKKEEVPQKAVPYKWPPISSVLPNVLPTLNDFTDIY